MKFSIIITSYNESHTISKAIEQLVPQAKWIDAEIIVVSADKQTLQIAQNTAQNQGFNNIQLIQDNGEGKPAALNLGVQKATSNILILTDGDMFVGENALSHLIEPLQDSQIGGVSGHPVSLDDRSKMFGYFSHLFCQAAHLKRQKDSKTAMSGYLYAFKNLPELFPLDPSLRAEDAYISNFILSKGFKLAYAPQAYAYVYFPKNMDDWFKQKMRSLGGNVQLERFTANLPQNSHRSLLEDVSMVLFPIKFAKSPIELAFSLYLYPVRLILWLKIYFQHKLNRYNSGRWEMITSSKQ